MQIHPVNYHDKEAKWAIPTKELESLEFHKLFYYFPENLD